MRTWILLTQRKASHSVLCPPGRPLHDQARALPLESKRPRLLKHYPPHLRAVTGKSSSPAIYCTIADGISSSEISLASRNTLLVENTPLNRPNT